MHSLFYSEERYWWGSNYCIYIKAYYLRTTPLAPLATETSFPFYDLCVKSYVLVLRTTYSLYEHRSLRSLRKLRFLLTTYSLSHYARSYSPRSSE